METKKTILIIEDEKILRESIHIGLESDKFQIIEARDGEEGLIVALREHPDLILLDLIMPKVDGMTMLKKLRSDDWGKAVPVIILTNLTSSNEQRNNDVVELTPSYYFEKTQMSIDQIIEKVNEILF